ncbi:helix-turn-helix domain-containing protein [Spirillospora sp. CA-253888]
MSTGSVALVMIDDMPLYELSLANEIFGVPRPDLADPWYELRLCGLRPGGVRAQFGFAAATGHGLEGLAGAGTVIVPALPYDYVLSDREIPPALTGALAEAARAGARMVSLCTGAFALAAAGLLDGRPATTHWMFAEIFQRRHPAVRFDASVLYVDDGDLLTSAGRTAALDLCLHLLRRDLGALVANRMARRMVVPAHRPGGQAQYVDAAVPPTDEAGLGPVLHWASAHLDRPLTVADLAARAGTSPRSFARHFTAATGTTPLRWLLDQRLTRARTLLEATGLPIDQIAERSGLGSAANMRRHFAAQLGLTPTAYRRMFDRRARR